MGFQGDDELPAALNRISTEEKRKAFEFGMNVADVEYVIAPETGGRV